MLCNELYGNLIFSKRHELDSQAYAKYYSTFPLDGDVLTYNSFYGTETHKRYLLPLLRKLKLEQIEKKSQI